MKVRRCAVCACSEFLPVLTITEGSHLAKCAVCSLVVLDPLPDEQELLVAYESTDWGAGALTANTSGFRDLVRLVRCFSQSRRLLDVGSWYGDFLVVARQEGFSVAAVEPNSEARRYLGERLDIDVVHDIEEAAKVYGSESFDIVSLFHVLEHMVDPQRTLQLIYGLLSMKGLVIIRVPNIKSMCFKLLGKGWGGVQRTHVVYYAPDTLGRLLENCGFQIELVKTRAFPQVNEVVEILKGVLRNVLGSRKEQFCVLLDGVLGGEFSKRKFRRYDWLQRSANTLTKPLYWLSLGLWRYFDRRGMGSEILAVATKSGGAGSP